VLVLVDGRNVQRSRWPNVSDEELVAAVERWARDEGHEAVVVFDGAAPEGAVGTGGESADDWIARRAAELEEPIWLVTSDRELRRRVGDRAAETTGGGGFLGLLGLDRRR
jgi:predicted RNA-binding protein with PIN domain